MNTRKVLTGCGVAAAVVLAIAVVGGVVTYNRLVAPSPLPEPARLVDQDSVGHAVLRLEPDNPWIRGMFAELSKYSTREPKTTELFPIEVIWSARRAAAGGEGHIISLSFSPRGALFGLMTDIALWRAGRSNDPKIARVVYGGEGITAFPGLSIPGDVFVRGSSIVWSSDLDTARRAVDLVLAGEKGAPPAAGGGAAAAPGVMKLVPPAGGHALVGAIAGGEGAVARTLALLPGGALVVPEAELSRADLSFVFDATEPDVAQGEVTLAFPQDARPADVSSAAEDLARRIGSLRWGQVAFEASPRTDGARAILSVKATGMTTLYQRLLQETVRVQRTLERGKEGAEPGGREAPAAPAPAADPNQSSSTFQ